MEKWKCNVCGYIYDPEKGDSDGNIAPNTPFRNYLTIGSARYAGPPRTCLKRLSQK
jgi:rubredoxin